jgi:hypothetical protein
VLFSPRRVRRSHRLVGLARVGDLAVELFAQPHGCLEETQPGCRGVQIRLVPGRPPWNFGLMRCTLGSKGHLHLLARRARRRGSIPPADRLDASRSRPWTWTSCPGSSTVEVPRDSRPARSSTGRARQPGWFSRVDHSRDRGGSLPLIIFIDPDAPAGIRGPPRAGASGSDEGGCGTSLPRS